MTNGVTLISNLNRGIEYSITLTQYFTYILAMTPRRIGFFGCFLIILARFFLLSYVERSVEGRLSRKKDLCAFWRVEEANANFYATGNCDRLMPPLHTLSLTSKSLFFFLFFPPFKDETRTKHLK
jgi:hypothetical protein